MTWKSGHLNQCSLPLFSCSSACALAVPRLVRVRPILLGRKEEYITGFLECQGFCHEFLMSTKNSSAWSRDCHILRPMPCLMLYSLCALHKERDHVAGKRCFLQEGAAYAN